MARPFTEIFCPGYASRAFLCWVNSSSIELQFNGQLLLSPEAVLTSKACPSSDKSDRRGSPPLKPTSVGAATEAGLYLVKYCVSRQNLSGMGMMLSSERHNKLF